MDYQGPRISIRTRLKRACADTSIDWRRELIGAIIFAGAVWWFLPKSEAVKQITLVAIAVVTAVVVLPLLDFGWNYLRAPERILREENQKLREQVQEYQSIQGIEEFQLNEQTVKGRWYGSRFILDEPMFQMWGLIEVEEHEENLKISAPPHSLARIRYEIQESPRYPWGKGQAQITIGRISSNGAKPLPSDGGVVDVPVNGESVFKYKVVQPKGNSSVVTFDLLGWETPG